MKFSNRLLQMLGGATLLAAGASAQTTLYNNLTATVNSCPNILESGPLYNSFSTGSAAVTLTDVKLNLFLSVEAGGSFTVALYSNAGNFPNTKIQALGTLNDTSISINGGVYDLPVSPGIALSPNTRYFIGVSGSSGTTDTCWASTNTTNGTGNIGNEYNCQWEFVGVGAAAQARHGVQPRGEGGSLECFSNVEDPFLMAVTANVAAVAAPDLSLTGMAVLGMLLAASAVLLLRRPASQAR